MFNSNFKKMLVVYFALIIAFSLYCGVPGDPGDPGYPSYPNDGNEYVYVDSLGWVLPGETGTGDDQPDDPFLPGDSIPML